MSTGQRRVRIRISGLVQGVFFRAYTQEEALKLGLTGWVRNLPDGSVEAMVEGDAARVDRMIAWCSKGSPQSAVSRVQVQEEQPSGEFGSFAIRYH